MVGGWGMESTTAFSGSEKAVTGHRENLTTHCPEAGVGPMGRN